MKPDLDFATLIGSRICHDLISPIGAVNNGLELLSMTGITRGPELDLIGGSVKSASARIRFFRVAFGSAGDQMMRPAEITATLCDYYGPTRWQVTWLPQNPVLRAHVRLAFLALLCLETGMPYGGAMTVDQAGDRWLLQGCADRLGIDPDLWSLLAGHPAKTALQPSQVQFGLMPAIAQEGGHRIKSSIGDTGIDITF